MRWAGNDDVEDDLLEDHPTRPTGPVDVAALRVLPDLPTTARPPARVRAGGWLLVAAGLLGAPVAEVFVADGRYQQVVIAVLGAQAVGIGAARTFRSIRLTRIALVIHGPWRRTTVPWARVRSVRRRGGELVIDWEPDGDVTVGPFATGPLPGGPSVALPPDGPRLSRSPGCPEDDCAVQLGAAALVLRDRSLAAGSPNRDIMMVRGPAWVLLPLYAVVLGGTLLMA